MCISPKKEHTAVTELCIAVLASRATVTSYHKLGGLKKNLSPETRSLQQKCQQDWFHLEALGEKSSHAFIQTSVGDSGHSFTSKFITPVSASIFTWPSPLCVSLSSPSLSLIRTLVSAFEAHLIQDNLSSKFLLLPVIITQSLSSSKFTF